MISLTEDKIIKIGSHQMGKFVYRLDKPYDLIFEADAKELYRSRLLAGWTLNYAIVKAFGDLGGTNFYWIDKRDPNPARHCVHRTTLETILAKGLAGNRGPWGQNFEVPDSCWVTRSLADRPRIGPRIPQDEEHTIYLAKEYVPSSFPSATKK